MSHSSSDCSAPLLRENKNNAVRYIPRVGLPAYLAGTVSSLLYTGSMHEQFTDTLELLAHIGGGSYVAFVAALFHRSADSYSVTVFLTAIDLLLAYATLLPLNTVWNRYGWERIFSGKQFFTKALPDSDLEQPTEREGRQANSNYSTRSLQLQDTPGRGSSNYEVGDALTPKKRTLTGKETWAMFGIAFLTGLAGAALAMRAATNQKHKGLPSSLMPFEKVGGVKNAKIGCGFLAAVVMNYASLTTNYLTWLEYYYKADKEGSAYPRFKAVKDMFAKELPKQTSRKIVAFVLTVSAAVAYFMINLATSFRMYDRFSSAESGVGALLGNAGLITFLSLSTFAGTVVNALLFLYSNCKSWQAPKLVSGAPAQQSKSDAYAKPAINLARAGAGAFPLFIKTLESTCYAMNRFKPDLALNYINPANASGVWAACAVLAFLLYFNRATLTRSSFTREKRNPEINSQRGFFSNSGPMGILLTAADVLGGGLGQAERPASSGRYSQV